MSPLFFVLAYVDPSAGGVLFQALAVIFTFLSGLIYFFSSQIKRGMAQVWRLIRERRGGGGEQGH